MKTKLIYQQKWHFVLAFFMAVVLSGCVKQPNLPQSVTGDISTLKKVAAKLIKENEEIKEQIFNQNREIEALRGEMERNKKIDICQKEADEIAKKVEKSEKSTQELIPFLIRVTKDRVNLRSEPRLDSSVYELLPKGKTLVATQRPTTNRGWYEVMHKGRISWVHKTLVEEKEVE